MRALKNLWNALEPYASQTAKQAIALWDQTKLMSRFVAWLHFRPKLSSDEMHEFNLVMEHLGRQK